MRHASRAATREGGFSMIELMVAMVITLLIMGSVYGLLAGGQNAFRREPEMAERQQNIRMAMDLIMRDVANAASGLPPFVQAFTPGGDACALCPMGPDNARTDELEMITNSESRNTEPICRTVGVANAPNPGGALIHLIRDVTTDPNPIPQNTVVIPFTANGQWTLRNLIDTVRTTAAVPNTGCLPGVGASGHTQLNLLQPGDTTGLNTPATPCEPNGWGNTVSPCELIGVSFANVVRYRIRLEAGTNVPMLERWSSDTPNSIVGPAPFTLQGFQTLARGIENMQIQYLPNGGNPGDPPAIPGDWVDTPPVVTPADWATLTTQVRVTLAARSEAQNIAGGTTSQTGGDRIRGTLMSAASPRATLMEISLAAGLPPPLAWR